MTPTRSPRPARPTPAIRSSTATHSTTIRPPIPCGSVIAELEELALRDRIHTNELVRKRDRGARFFVPEAPRLVRLPH